MIGKSASMGGGRNDVCVRGNGVAESTVRRNAGEATTRLGPEQDRGTALEVEHDVGGASKPEASC